MAMQIEYPEDPVPRPLLLAPEEETFPSIGEFYDAILEALQENDGEFQYQTDKQLANDSPSVFVIDGLLKATTAITTIQKEGEGSSRFPFVDPQRTQLAHFYLFGELFFGQKYEFNDATQTGDWSGNRIQIPAVFPMTPVPLGGYGENAPDDVLACDTAFTQLLQQLDQAWANGDPNALSDAVSTMFVLKRAAIKLLQKQIRRPEGGIFGPQFRKRPPA
jgi:Ferritin-like